MRGDRLQGDESCYVDLYWLPVAAGTWRLQRWALALWERFEAARARRPRAALYHSALKLRTGGEVYTLELTPVFHGEDPPHEVTGSVGFRGAGRWRLFRYQIRLLRTDRFPDEQWAVGAPLRLSVSCEVTALIPGLLAAIPKYTWGWRAECTTEMWTSDSAISWLLLEAGIAAANIALPSGGRAPGWKAGIEEWSQRAPA